METIQGILEPSYSVDPRKQGLRRIVPGFWTRTRPGKEHNSSSKIWTGRTRENKTAPVRSELELDRTR